MPPSGNGAVAEPQSGPRNALDYAVGERDRATMDMVREAVATRNVVLAFQPVVHATQTDRPAFYEGLIRIRDHTGRIIPAAQFIGAIETSELGRMIDCLALELGLAELAVEPGLRLSINMSARSIDYPRWMDTLRHGLARHASIGERLILEITESSAMLMPDLVTAFMQDLQSAGVCFALDDFGAGFTSFRYLREFYFDIVKIDGQFITGIADNPDNQVLTEALILIARQFDMFVVAESVESARDAEYLAGIGVDCLQGYHFSAPVIHPHWREDAKAKTA